MNTKAFRRKLTAAIGAITACATLTCGGVGAAHAEERDTLGDSVLNAYNALNGNGMRFEKVSHPQAGLRAADGVVDYIGNGMITEADKGQGDRGQSYSYAAASHCDWVYIGTMYGGLVVQAILSHGMASNMGMSAEAAKNLMQTMYAGHMYLGEPDGKSAGGMLFKFNVKTGETKILMSKSAGIEGGKGIIPTFRSAFEMNGKLYFEGMVMDTANPDLDQREIQTAIAMQNGFPCIYEIDPANGDKLTLVHNSVDTEGFRTLVNQKVFTSTRAIGSFKDTLIAGDLKIDANGNGAAYLVASSTPSVPGSYKVIADMASFDNLPAIHRSDVNGGGGIYQVLEFNGKLYVVVCTGNADTRNEQTGTLRSFAIYVGENNGDATNKADWSWRPLVGDTAKGAKYAYGLDASRVSAGACTLQVFGDHLYIGDYNDVSSALQGFAMNMDFVTQATNLEQSINLYRMDANENVEMLVGDANETFPDGGSTGLGSGYGNNMNQYTWQTAVHEGKMYLSTMNTTTLLEPIAQFTNGDILHMSAQEWKTTVQYLRAFLEIVFKGDDAATFSRTRSVRPSADDPDALVEWACQQAGARAASDAPARTDADGDAQEEVALTDAQRESLVKGIKDGSIVPESLDDANTAGELFAINSALGSLTPQLDELASEEFVDAYADLLAALTALPKVPESLKKLYETLLKLASKQNMQAFFKSLPYLAKSKRGFNLFEISEDAQGGVKVETMADDGFGDPFNHGLRIFSNTDDYMLIGTANPFYGTQLWRVANTLFPVHVSAGKGGTASADKTVDVAPDATVTLTATPDDGYRFAGWKVNQGGVVIADDNTFAMPSHSVYIEARFERTADTPETPDTPDTPGTGDDEPGKPTGPGANGPSYAQPGSTTTTGTPVTGIPAGGSQQTVELASTGASTIALMVAAATAIAAGGAMIALKRKRA